MRPSPYQEAIYTHIVDKPRDSLLVEAVAGSGKTTTLIEALHRVSIRTHPKIIMLAFNKIIASELAARVPEHVDARTIHSCGYAVIRRNEQEVVVLNNKKVQNILQKRYTDDVPYRIRRAAADLVSAAKNNLFHPLSPIQEWKALFDHSPNIGIEIDSEEEPRLFEMASYTLKRNNAITREIDFDDMIYLPLIREMRFHRYHFIGLDEAQDIAPIQRRFVQESLADGGTVMASGDRHQAIYGFRGADYRSMDAISTAFGCTPLPLSVSYRCPRSIVELAKAQCPHIEPWDEASDGSIQTIERPDDAFERMRALDSFMVVCRNNAPLVRFVLELAKRRIRATIVGRDIGKSFAALLKTFKAEAKDYESLNRILETWAERQTLLARLRSTDMLEFIEDRVACLYSLLDAAQEQAVSFDRLEDFVLQFFSAEEGRGGRLYTIHRAKGLEADNVFFLDKWLIPSRYAKTDAEIQQENNLWYVAVTRTRKNLYYINSPRFDREE